MRCPRETYRDDVIMHVYTPTSREHMDYLDLMEMPDGVIMVLFFLNFTRIGFFVPLRLLVITSIRSESHEMDLLTSPHFARLLHYREYNKSIARMHVSRERCDTYIPCCQWRTECHR